MCVTLVNCGLAVAFVGAIVLVAAAFDFDPVKAFREKNGGLEVDPQLFKKLGHRLRWGIISPKFPSVLATFHSCGPVTILTTLGLSQADQRPAAGGASVW